MDSVVVLRSSRERAATLPALQLVKFWRERSSLQRHDAQTGRSIRWHGCQPGAGARLCCTPQRSWAWRCLRSQAPIHFVTKNQTRCHFYGNSEPMCVSRKLPGGQCRAMVLHQPRWAKEMWAVGSQHKVRPAGVCQSRLDAWLHRENQGKRCRSQSFKTWIALCGVLLHQLQWRVPLPQRDEVDAVSLDATHSFIAGKCGLVPVVTEYYGKTVIMFKLSKKASPNPD